MNILKEKQLKKGHITQRSSNRLRTLMIILSLCIFLSTISSSFINDSSNINSKVQKKFSKDVHHFYNASKALREGIQLKSDIQSIQLLFIQTKLSYKTIEYMIEYLDPSLGKKLNGAPVPSVLVEQEKYQALNYVPPVFRTFPPQGLQVLEELLFSEVFEEKHLNEAIVLALAVEEQALLFINAFNNQPLNDRQILESCREEVIRIMTLGITGFDAPAAGNEIKFCTTAMEAVQDAILLYQEHPDTRISELAKTANNQLRQCLHFLQTHENFDSFDRIYFIRELADPAFGILTELQNVTLQKQHSYAKPVNDKAKSIFDKNFLHASFYAKQDPNEQKELIHLGRSLFFDPILSSSNERSCASCHNPSKAFTDGFPKSIAFDFKGSVARNSPTLLNAVFSNAYFWDSRTQYLQDQVPAVILKEDELHGSYKDVINKLNQSREYKSLFKNAFNTTQANFIINANTINRAIAAYVQSLVALDSPFDKYMRGETDTLNNAAQKGFNLFMGKAGCGTCHFSPIFNGTVPPRYIESESEVLGVPDDADLKIAVLDKDPGKAAFIPAEVLKHSFKTPTIRNAALTAPYMHNGIFTTLEEVVNFYDLGGGAALGFDIDNQTLPSEPLNLTEEEKKDIVAFLNSLSDLSQFSSPPSELPAFNKKSSLNKRIIGGMY